MRVPLISPAGFQLLPYDCHEGNYMLPNVLRGERAEDKALEEDAKKGIIRARKPVQFNERAAPAEGTAAGENGPPPRADVGLRTSKAPGYDVTQEPRGRTRLSQVLQPANLR